MKHLIALCLALTACTTNNGTGGGDDEPTPDGNPDVAITPAAGVWTYTSLTKVSDTCNTNIEQDPGDFAIDQTSATGFHATPKDGSAPFSCTLDTGDFACGDRVAGTYDLHPAMDATVTYRVVATGTLSDATHASGAQDGTATCTGTACGTIANFPCTIKATFKVRAK